MHKAVYSPTDETFEVAARDPESAEAKAVAPFLTARAAAAAAEPVQAPAEPPKTLAQALAAAGQTPPAGGDA